MNKQLISFLLALALLITIIPASAFASEPAPTLTASPKYLDTTGHWAQAVIDRWSNYKVVDGKGNQIFDPDGLLTRAEAAQIFANLLRLTEEADISAYPDAQNAWYTAAFAKCYKAGIIKGLPDGTMAPGGLVTREEFFTMYARAIKLSAGLASEESQKDLEVKGFADAAEISSWALDAIWSLVNKGYIHGISADELAPKAHINRASVLALFDQSITEISDAKGIITFIDGSTLRFKEVEVAVDDDDEGTYVPPVAPPPAHEHVYTEIVTDAALKSSATCTQKAVYYKSCVTDGALSAETFEAGDFAAHNFTNTNTSAAFLKSAATCTQEAVYFKSCVCGATDAACTFTDGDKAPHTYSVYATDTNLNHKLICADCGDATPESHNFTAYTSLNTTSHSATCSSCGAVVPELHQLATYTNINETSHSATCISCSAVVVEAHNFVAGNGVATCSACGATTDIAVRIGTVGYKSLTAAFAAAQDGDTVTLEKDISDEITYTNGKIYDVTHTITLNLNGHTITYANFSGIGSSTTIFRCSDNSNVFTITGAGVITSRKYDGTSYGQIILGGNVVIGGGTYDGLIKVYEIGDMLTVINGSFNKKIIVSATASMAIEGGTFKVLDVTAGGGSKSITGGIFEFDPRTKVTIDTSAYDVLENVPSSGLWTVAPK